MNQNTDLTYSTQHKNEFKTQVSVLLERALSRCCPDGWPSRHVTVLVSFPGPLLVLVVRYIS